MPGALQNPNDCCTPCEDPVISNLPGATGAAGSAGAAGTNGVNAFTTTTANFTMPASGANVTVSVGNSDWMVAKTGTAGQVVIVGEAGHFEVQSKPGSTSVILKNLGYATNAAPATVIGTGKGVAPSGSNGTDGASGTNSFPTTAVGDLIVGQSATPGDVARLAKGTDGQVPVYDAVAALDITPKSILPNATGSTDNRIGRLNTPLGTELPAPIQTSDVAITDTGAIQHSGGNAKGTNAVDLQPSRTLATQVASGANASLIGGKDSTASGLGSVACGDTALASGTRSVAIGGLSLTASAQEATAIGGNNNVASGADSVAIGGNTNTVSAIDGAVIGGNNHTVSGVGSSAIGGNTNTVQNGSSAIGGAGNTLEDQSCQSLNGCVNANTSFDHQTLFWANSFTTDGDAQGWIAGGSVSNAGVSAADLVPAGGSVFNIDSPRTWIVQGVVVGRRSDGASAMWEFKAGIKNVGGTVSLVGAPTVSLLFTDAVVSATWGVAGTITILADNVNKALTIRSGASLGDTVRFVATIKAAEVGF